MAGSKISATYNFKFCSQSFSCKTLSILLLPQSNQVLSLIKSGIGIGFGSEFMINEALVNGDIEEIPLEIPPLNRSICLVEDKSKILSLAARKLKKYMCK